MRITADCILVQDREPNAATLDDVTVLLSVRAGSYFEFNRVGSEIWTMLAEPRRVDEVFAALSQNHHIDSETVARDVTPFLEALVTLRLVRMIGADQVA